ncbi:ABC transporter ATP-binding protein [Alkalicoccus chagannorensis]|uniref:ABC transporter ATP-binding protein n=1 Tax=Alkalicoccus chagannorensis TaxID=427072 RepID=UPI000420C586|nr:ABC transporter ATP-binding protein [Alkalicoccus chagannorensis]
MLKTEHITKTFGSFQALQDVSLEVNEGEIFGFIGPNGSGKSTTIRILLGVLQATSGRAEIFGKDVWKDAVEIHKHLAYVPGDVHLWPNLTGGEVIDLFARLRGHKKPVDKDKWLERFDLDPTKKCRTYSKGNRQKVALVSAFTSQADLFILDEPTSGLDPLMERVFQESIRELSREGKSVLLSSHILSEVEKLCDRVAIIREGAIIETGSLEELRHLTRTQLLVEAKQPVTGLEAWAHELEETDGGLRIQVDTEQLDEVVRHLAGFGITKLESAPPTLEDLFMHHYERRGGGAS